jgi:hypothetical protein
MASDDSQKQDYEKKGAEHGGTHMSGAHGGSSGSSGGTGPTGSSRTYPKGKGHSFKTDWNPQKIKASTYGICGV